jgi:hypothetical protein
MRLSQPLWPVEFAPAPSAFMGSPSMAEANTKSRESQTIHGLTGALLSRTPWINRQPTASHRHAIICETILLEAAAAPTPVKATPGPGVHRELCGLRATA